jgi:hypothetical protein
MTCIEAKRRDNTLELQGCQQQWWPSFSLAGHVEPDMMAATDAELATAAATAAATTACNIIF